MKKINIIIPARKISEILISNINILKKQNFDNFLVTIVVDKKNYNKKLNFGRYINIISLNGSKNMSIKRNYAAKKIKSKYLVFLDSDAYPESKNWLKNGVKYLNKYKKNGVIISGGPDLSPKIEQKENALSGILDKSFLISGFRNYRKNKQNSKFVKQLASCNMFIRRSDYLLLGGMDESMFTGEDADLCNRVITKGKKIFYHPSISVFHYNRAFKPYLIQRIDRAHESAKATKQLFSHIFFKNISASYNKKNFRYEFLINPLLAIYLLGCVLNLFLFKINFFVIFFPIILYLSIVLIESIRITPKPIFIVNVFFRLNTTVLLQSFFNLYFLIFKDNFLKKKYFNKNDK